MGVEQQGKIGSGFGHGGVYCEDCDIADMQTSDSPRFMHVAPWAVDDDSAQRLWEMTAQMLA